MNIKKSPKSKVEKSFGTEVKKGKEKVEPKKKKVKINEYLEKSKRLLHDVTDIWRSESKETLRCPRCKKTEPVDSYFVRN